MIDDNKYMVCVRCMTYNQAQYIEDTLNGFCMQNTHFPFVCVIVDDASNDGEQEVIKKYLENNFFVTDDKSLKYEDTDDYILTFAQHKTNKYCNFAVFYLKYNHWGKKAKFPYYEKLFDQSKYIAICEGDDYWIDNEKLQKQVDFMESHLDYGMVHTDFNLTNGIRHHFKEKLNEDGNWFPRILTEGLPVGTVTVLYRKSIFDITPKLYRDNNWPMGDLPLWIELAHEAKVKYMPFVTSKYRVLENSASHSKDINRMIAFENAMVQITTFYADYYRIELPSQRWCSYYANIIRYACRLNEKEIAQTYYKKARDKKMLTNRARLFYVATKCPIIKRLIDFVIKI